MKKKNRSCDRSETLQQQTSKNVLSTITSTMSKLCIDFNLKEERQKKTTIKYYIVHKLIQSITNKLLLTII